MELHFRDTTVAQRVAKRLAKRYPHLKLSQAQAMVAHMFGYKDWHHLHRVCENNRLHGNSRTHDYTDDQAPKRLEAMARRLSTELGITVEAANGLLPDLVPDFLIGKRESPNLGDTSDPGMQTLLYCDLDGVLHRWPCPEAEMFHADCIARLATVIRPHDVGLVITSTWRLEWRLERIRERMGALGKYVVGVTPEIDDPFLRFGRYHEVLRHRQEQALAASPWVAIDDEAGRYPEDLRNLILTDPKTGFSEKDAVTLSCLLDQQISARGNG